MVARPPFRENLRLFQHGLRRLLLLVRRVAMPALEATDHDSSMCWQSARVRHFESREVRAQTECS